MEILAQEYVSPLQPVEVGKSPGVKVKLISKSGKVQTYVLIFSPGDEVRSGLTEFARKYNIKSAQYSAIGDATFVKVAFFDYDKKMFKAIPIKEPSEVASLTGDIALFNGNPVAHTHVSIATEDDGHLILMANVGDRSKIERSWTSRPKPLSFRILRNGGRG